MQQQSCHFVEGVYICVDDILYTQKCDVKWQPILFFIYIVKYIAFQSLSLIPLFTELLFAMNMNVMNYYCN